MSSPSVTIQIAPESSPTMPTFMGEVAAFAHVLAHTGMLKTIQEHVRFSRARFGQYPRHAQRVGGKQEGTGCQCSVCHHRLSTTITQGVESEAWE